MTSAAQDLVAAMGLLMAKGEVFRAVTVVQTKTSAREGETLGNGTAPPVAGDAPANRAEHVCPIGPGGFR